MSKIKSLILGSAAVIAASAGAQAADLPVKAKAVQYVKICSFMAPVSTTSRHRHLHQAGRLRSG
jgi:hypothetical protein